MSLYHRRVYRENDRNKFKSTLNYSANQLHKHCLRAIEPHERRYGNTVVYQTTSN